MPARESRPPGHKWGAIEACSNTDTGRSLNNQGDQILIHGTIADEETGETEDITIRAYEVYQRQNDGEWKQILSLPYLPFQSIDEV